MELPDPRVQLQPEGVHVVVDSLFAQGDMLFLASRSGRYSGGFDSWTMHLEEGENRITWPLVPGTTYVNCFSTSTFDSLSVHRDELVKIQVVDPEGLWRSSELACTNTVDADVARVDASAMADSAEDAIRLQVPGVLHADVVAKAGYPSGSPALFWLVTRGDQNLGIFWVGGDYDGTRRVYFGAVCPGSGIGGA
jgi:hypothetical protein